MADETRGTRTHEADAELQRTATRYAEMGVHLVPIGYDKRPALGEGYVNDPPGTVTATALRMIGSAEAGGIAAVLGARSLRELPNGESLVLVGLELEGKATADVGFMREWRSALEAAGLTATLGQMREGWFEGTPSGGLRWFFWVPVDDDAEWQDIYDALPSKRCSRAWENQPSACWAEILAGPTGYAVIAPTKHGHRTGKPWVLHGGGPDTAATVDARTLTRFAEVLADLSDEANQPAATAALDPRTAEVRRIYNARHGDTAATVELLERHGWKAMRTRGDGRVEMAWVRGLDRPANVQMKVGGAKFAPGSLHQFSASDSRIGQGHHTAFDVLCALEHEGDAMALADELVEKGVVRLTVAPLTPSTRKKIRIDETETPRLAASVAQALADAQHPFDKDQPFVMTRRGATLDAQPIPVSVDRDGSARLWPERDHAELALTVVQPMRKRAKGPDLYGHDLPKSVVTMAMRAALGGEGLRSVQYLGTTPLLVPSGKVMHRPGYHPREMALVAIPRRDRGMWAAAYRDMPERPTKRDAQRAFDYILREVLSDFVFATPADRARAAAHLLTAAARGLLPNVMALLVTAPDRGSGKTLLALLTRLIATGSSAAVRIGYARKEDAETRKSIVSGARIGRTYFHCDEIARGDAITSTLLSELITAPDGASDLRLLGGNELIPLYGAMWSFCGNNVEPGADFNRRLLPVRLEYRGEGMPHRRTGFRHENIAAWVLQNRARLLRMLQTVLLYGLQNPVSISAGKYSMGSFERQAEVVVGALTHVTIDGTPADQLFAEGLAEWQDSADETADEWGPMLVWWAAQFGTRWVKTPDLMKAATSGRARPDLPSELVETVGAESDAARARAWGRVLIKRRSQSVMWDGVQYRIEADVDQKRGNKYRVTRAGEAPQDADVVQLAGAESAPTGEAQSEPAQPEKSATKASAKPEPPRKPAPVAAPVPVDDGVTDIEVA